MSENLLTLIGVIFDVSGSMKSSIGDGVYEKGEEWTRSIFHVIDNLIKHDLSSSNKMFCLGLGANWGKNLIFDLIGMLNCFPVMPDKKLSFDETIENILEILENNGADAVRKWASLSLIKNVVSEDFATIILVKLRSDPEFVKNFVEVCLPKACKGFKPEAIKSKKGERKRITEYVNTKATYNTSSKTMKSEDSIVYRCRFKCSYNITNKTCTGHTINGFTCNWQHNCNFPSCMCKTDFRCILHWICSCQTCQSYIKEVYDVCQSGCSFVKAYGGRLKQCDMEHNCPLEHCHECHSCFFYHPHVQNCSAQESIRRHPVMEVGATVSSWCIEKGEKALSFIRPATEEDIQMVVEKAKSLIDKEFTDTDSPLIYSVQHASRIINGCAEDSLTEKRIQDLMELVKPFIYGATPMFHALKKAEDLFSDEKYHDHKKLLFVLSDGMPTDIEHRSSLFTKFEDVTVVSCYISKMTTVKPRRLYSTPCGEWENGAKFLFNLSSKIKTQLLPRTLFIKRGWHIDIKNNETRLFAQVNHPDNVKDACSLAREVVFCQDSLADILASVSLDLYINQSAARFCPPKQEGGTCYANASAAVLHLSMKRIIGREGGYPDFNDLRQQIITHFGSKGANTLSVLKTCCLHYRLECRKVDINEAMHAITAKRPVVATFRLTHDEWDAFSNFYKTNGNGILTQNEINLLKRDSKAETSGHAVVFTSYNSNCLRFMNSWGTEWGNKGFFNVKNADVLEMKFIDVFWTINNLTKSEVDYYTKHGAGVAATLQSRLTGLKRAKYNCPVCYQESCVTKFRGQLFKARCPKCHNEFSFDTNDNILALNMYLTSLCK